MMKHGYPTFEPEDIVTARQEFSNVKIVQPSVEFWNLNSQESVLAHLERCGRVCYKSEDKITDDSAKAFIGMLLKRGHLAILEHVSITAKFICDRGVSHELVRHRIASYAQESTRYCNYSKGKFGGITVVDPCFWPDRDVKGSMDSGKYALWLGMMKKIDTAYQLMIDLGESAQVARDLLANSLKTEIVVTMNVREWRYFLELRTKPDCHPQMRQVAYMALNQLNDAYPVLFGDIHEKAKWLP